MAIFRLQISSIARGDGHSSVGAAAYRAGERIRDDRTNEVYNHSRRKDVTHSEIMLPGSVAGQNMEWALNRASLWNSVENAESRRNSRVANEIQVTLPHELPPERRVALARSFSQELADHYKVAVDLAVHEPRSSGDPRNFHAHLLMTTREVSPEGLGAKAGINLQNSDRLRLGLPNISQEVTAIRERWAEVSNEALREASIEARVDHRSLADQGIDREPKPHIPFAVYKIERAGKHSEVAESIRADYQARVQARLESVADHGPDQAAATARVPTTKAPATTQAPAAAQAPAAPQEPAPNTAPKSLDDIRREARENWLKMRPQQPAASADQPATTVRTAATATASTLARGAIATAVPASAAGSANNTQSPPRTDHDHQL